MSIVTQCPHCETKFNLQAEMAGKSMQCPNLDCRKVFVVKAGARPTEPPPPAPPPPTVPAKPRSPDKPKLAKPKAEPEVVEAKVVEAKVVDAAVVKPPRVKEVVWTEGTDVPPPAGKRPRRAEAMPEPDADDLAILRRRRKKERGPWLLIGMSVAVVMLLGFGVLYVLNIQGKNEATLASLADEEFEKKQYQGAQQQFEALAANYPDSESAPRYKFFADLARLHLAVGDSANRTNPDKAVALLKEFVRTHKDSPFVKGDSPHAQDVQRAGRKLGGDVAAFASARVEEFRSDRVANATAREDAEKAIGTGRELLTWLEPFPPPEPDDTPLGSIRDQFDATAREIEREQARTDALARAETQLQNLSDEVIYTVEGDLTAAGFVSDESAKKLLSDARVRLRGMIKYEAEAVPVPPQAVPTSAAATILFVTQVGVTQRPPVRGVGESAAPSVFLAIARGILYALHEDSGALLWAVRIGPDVTDAPAIARVTLDDGPTDLAIVTSNSDGNPAVASYEMATGVARWYQPLPAPAVGPAAIVGGRAYVAIRDSAGSVLEFDLTTGMRTGRIQLAQTAGPGPVVRPGTGLIYLAGDARRVFVIDAGAINDDGVPLPPRCVQVIATGHPSGTLRTSPVLIGPAGYTTGERWMVLAQANGPTATKIRAFQLPVIATAPIDGTPPAEFAAAAAAELPVPGWVWFPPVTDGERLAMVTDTGHFRLFGVNQPGNFDRALFLLPTPDPTATAEGTVRPGLIIPAEESAFWVVANGVMQKYQLALVPARGLEVARIGSAVPLGDPTQAPQLNNRSDSACLVVRPPNSAGSRAVLVNLATGELRWQRQLGIVPAVPPIPQEGSVILAAEDGALVSIPSMGATTSGSTTVAPPAWVLAGASERANGPTRVAVSADRKTIFTITPIDGIEAGKPVAKWLIRKLTGGQVSHEGTAIAPGIIAGDPVIVGDAVLVPVADGLVYRHSAGTGRANPDTLLAGPSWMSGATPGATPATAAQGFITPVTASSFLTNDGGKKLAQWNWPKAGQWTQIGGGWELRERAAGPGMVLPATADEPAQLLIADVTGNVWLYAADRAGQPTRRWRPGTGLPSGTPTSGFTSQTLGNNRSPLTYTVANQFVVCLDPTKETVRWFKKLGSDGNETLVGSPSSVGDGRWLISDLSGRVKILDKDGETVGTLATTLRGAVPATSMGVAGETIMAPLSDGSAVILPLPKPATAPGG